MAPEGQRSRALRVLIATEAGRPVSALGLARWLARVAPARARGSVGIALVGDGRVRALNRQYRRRDYATDVLSFPWTSELKLRPPSSQPNPQSLIPNSYPYLGDIVIARGVARRQARTAGHSVDTELRILALHGLLHLLGYDHERDRGNMARVERRLRKKAGLPEGLIARSTKQ